MSKNRRFSLTSRLQSFVHAFNGIRSFAKTEHNAWIHLAAAIFAIGTGILLKIGFLEWILVAVAIGIVFIAELFNTSVELLTDIVSPEINPNAKRIKDISAGAVLVASLLALTICLMIVYRHTGLCSNFPSLLNS